MQNFPPANLHNDEHVEDTETGGDHDEEVTRYDSLSAMRESCRKGAMRIGCPASILLKSLIPLVAGVWRPTQGAGERQLSQPVMR